MGQVNLLKNKQRKFEKKRKNLKYFVLPIHPIFDALFMIQMSTWCCEDSFVRNIQPWGANSAIHGAYVFAILPVERIETKLTKNFSQRFANPNVGLFVRRTWHFIYDLRTLQNILRIY